MKKTGKKLLAIATAVSLAALALSGCGGGSAAPSSAAQPSETKKEEAQKQAEAAGAESSAGDADYTQGDPIVIKIAHVSQEGVPIDLASNRLGEMLKEKTGGRITVDVFPASALGNNTELLEQLQMGTLEMAISSVAFLGAFTDSTALLDLPYLFQSNEAAEEVLDGEVGQEIFSNLEPAGFKGMTWMATGWRQLTANKEIHKPEDMKGLKIRVMEIRCTLTISMRWVRPQCLWHSLNYIRRFRMEPWMPRRIPLPILTATDCTRYRNIL